MHRVRHPLLERARQIAAELEWERAACDVCSSRGAIASPGKGSLARGDEPEPCPGCLGVSYVWINPRREIFNVEELIEEHGRQRTGELGGSPCAGDSSLS
jgi:hypothetical protein